MRLKASSAEVADPLYVWRQIFHALPRLIGATTEGSGDKLTAVRMMRSLYRERLRKPRVETPPSANGRNSIIAGGGGRRGSGGRKGSKDLSEVMAKRRSESYAMPPSGEIGFLEAVKEQAIGGGGGGSSSLGASAEAACAANAILVCLVGSNHERAADM